MPGFIKNKKILLLLWAAIIIFSGLETFAQKQLSTKTIVSNNDTIVLKAINITSITSSIEVVLKEISDISKEIQPIDKIASFDSIYLISVEELNLERDLIENTEDNSNSRVLSDANQQWTNYKNTINNWQIIISDYSVLLGLKLHKTEHLIIIWELTLKDARAENAPDGITLNIREIITKLKTLKNEIKSSIIEIYSKQSKLTELNILIDESIKLIVEQQKSLRSEFFTQDSPPIWRAYDSAFFAIFDINIYNKYLKEISKTIVVFYNANEDNLVTHFIVFLILIGLFYFLHKYAIKPGEDEETDIKVSEAKLILNQYFLSAIIIGIVAIIWIYPTRQLIVNDLFQFILLITITVFLPNIFNNRIRTILYCVIGLHFINQFELVFPQTLFVIRILLFMETVLIFITLRKILDKNGEIYKGINNSKWKPFLSIIKLYYIGTTVPLIANIFGFIGLVGISTNIIIYSIISGLIAYVSYLIIVNAFVIITKSDFMQRLHTFKKYSDNILKHLINYTTIAAILLWSKSVLKLFGVYGDFFDWWLGLFNINWQFSTFSIDLGSVLSFILIIIVTIIIANLVKVVLEEEIFLRFKLPRGIPGAISMIVRYFIVGWGIAISISALGIDLSQFGLIAGALGVGIGFGLQNVVFNFIAGLILAFERPIQVGDTIEAGTVMGIVKSIGVRSSTIQTFDGSEVIVPNGNLISNDVINWTLSDRRKRRDIFVGVEYGSDPHAVMEVLKTAALGNINVLQNPEPWVLFEGFGDSSLNFRIRIWTSLDVGLTTKSEVTIAIYDGLKKANISIPFPQRDLHLKTMVPEVQSIITSSNKDIPNRTE